MGKSPGASFGILAGALDVTLLKTHLVCMLHLHQKSQLEGSGMQDNWVDFKAVKSAVDILAVLDHYQINWLRKSKDELRGRCPIHNGQGDSSFHVNLRKNAFNCFSCKARGNVLDFVAAMEKCSVRDAGA